MKPLDSDMLLCYCVVLCHITLTSATCNNSKSRCDLSSSLFCTSYGLILTLHVFYSSILVAGTARNITNRKTQLIGFDKSAWKAFK